MHRCTITYKGGPRWTARRFMRELLKTLNTL